MIHDLYLRAHIAVSRDADEQAEKPAKRSVTPKLWPGCALIWDTETSLDLEQTLNFGVWRFCELQGTEYVAVQEGIFYRDGVDCKDVQTILAYKQGHLADQLAVLSRAEFVEKVFWEAVRAGAMIVGFNLSFDISRIRVHWTTAHNGGFSFVLSQLNKKRVENRHRPRIRIAPLNGVAERIELTAVRRKNEQHKWRRFRPLDLHTLAFALTDNSYSLAGAIQAFGSEPKKMDHEPTGLITESEMAYARQDVHATLGLLNALKHEYELHPIALRPDQAYSPASIGKAYLRGMGIVEPMRKFKNIPPRIHGIAMAAYYGGRAECRIRRWPVPVVPVDLKSEYPSVDALLGIWDVLTAARLSIQDATEDVRALLAKVTLDDAFHPTFWKQLNFFALIAPESDVLPVRSVYDRKSGTCNIGLNALHWKQPMWVAGPELIDSVLLSESGRVPHVLEAFRIVPHGKQRGLRPIELRSAVSIDPRKEDFFTRVIEYRELNKDDDRLQYFLKILANSSSYGTYLELNPVKTDPGNRPKITVYSGDQVFEQTAPDTIEQPGSFYFPLLGALITSGGRLLLAMIERCVRDAGGTYLCCDTDALIIVASKAGGAVEMPDGAPAIKALSWSEVDQIRTRFDSLSPYNREIVPNLLRLTDENYDENGAQRQLYGLSIAAKRYALYTTKCGQPYCSHRVCVTIVDPKAHGLIFFAPSEEREKGLPKWWWELWRFLLMLEFKEIIEPNCGFLLIGGRAIDTKTTADVDGQPSWIALPAMMKMRISTPHYLDQMKGKASPFGFVLHPRTRDKLTLLTPFSRNRAGWVHSQCINTHDGRVYNLAELSRADIVTLGDILCGYIQHPEIKSLGPDESKCRAHTRGLLQRMTINGGLHWSIGKEVSRFEQGKDDFIENIDDVCIHYDGGRVVANDSLIATISSCGLRKTTKETGLDRKTIRRILDQQKVKASTLAKVVMGLRRE